MKRLLCILFALLILTAASACAEAGENLVVNGDFSEVDSLGLPEGWSRGMWFTDAGVSTLRADADGYEGGCAAVVNADPNDARFMQTIEVEPDSLYRFSCMVRAEGCGDGGYGATLSFEGTFSYSDSVLDTDGEWRKLTVYGRSGADQTQVTLMLRVGGYGSLNTGRAWFDDVEAVKIDALPEGARALSLAPAQSSGDSAAAEEESGAPKRNTEAYLLLALLYGAAMLAIARRGGRIRRAHFSAEALLAVGLSAALILRLFLSASVRGYNTDINCFSGWSERMFERGPGAFYAEDYFCDYPPGYMLLLWLPAALRNLFGLALQSPAHLMLLKFIPVLCDLLGALLIWRAAKRRAVNARTAAVLALLYAFNPAVLIDSAAWGQIDSVFTLLIALCALEAADERYVPSLLAFAAAMLIKPQAMLFAPLGLFAIVVQLVRSRDGKKLKQFLLGLGAALALIYLTALLFYAPQAASPADALIGPVRWICALYSETLGSYAYLTINALNLYTLLGYNWTPMDAQPLWMIFAWCMFALSYLYAGLLCLKSKRRHNLLLAGGTLIVLIFTFGPKIHERYVFPALLLLSLAYAFGRDRRVLASLTVLTITTAMNELLVLQGGMGAGNYGHLQSSEQWLNALLSIANVLNALYLSWTALDVCAFDHICLLRPEPAIPDPDAAFALTADAGAEPAAEADGGASTPPRAKPRGHRLNLRRADYLLMAVVTALYAVLAFTNLGATQAPQTSWVSSQSGENIVFDLGAAERFRMTYYGGICNSTFTVELSNDGETWTEPCRAEYDQGEIFRWIWYVPQNDSGEVLYDQTWDPGDGSAYVAYATHEEPYPLQRARYVRITALSAGLRLSEVGFWGEDGALIPAKVLSRSGEYADYAVDPELLLDEQDCVAAYPSYLNGTYFDEIYHARTAYELQNGLTIYEWTHPPLGKVVMMLGIELFGMTPFGWRFMGALTGVLMLPLMYLLAKQLTKSTKLSFVAMCLLALDSMHFTQTRIATIDSYAVFWIMLMYFFMIRYIQMDWREVKLGRSFIPLGLCGLTMGAAIATKWIGAYAAVGLAVLLFWKLIAETLRAGELRREYLRRDLLTVLFCLGFFVVIPLMIYYLSYTLQLRYEGVTSVWDMFSKERVQRVVELQQSMLNYHAGLGGDTHYFRSPWYQWPVIWWPMWYFSGTAYMPEGMISSISCMGNPAVWWSGLIALVALLVAAAWRRRAPKNWIVVLIGFASQFLPWVLVPRSTFIYHYFASVPFIILCTVLMLDLLRKKSESAFKWTACGLIALALILFAAFYPLESGLPVSRDYAQYLRWFNWYNF